jgi:hypothetical protein
MNAARHRGGAFASSPAWAEAGACIPSGPEILPSGNRPMSS